MEKILKKLFNLQQAYRSTKDKRNEFGKFNYRSAERMLSDLKPLLSQEKLVLSFSETIDETQAGTLIMKCTATIADIETGETTSTSTSVVVDKTLPGMCSGQASGAGTSYARKYCLCGLLSVDDGSNDLDSLNHNTQQTVSTDQLRFQIDSCSSVDQLKGVWNNMDDKQKASLKSYFSVKKKELLEFK